MTSSPQRHRPPSFIINQIFFSFSLNNESTRSRSGYNFSFLEDKNFKRLKNIPKKHKKPFSQEDFAKNCIDIGVKQAKLEAIELLPMKKQRNFHPKQE